MLKAMYPCILLLLVLDGVMSQAIRLPEGQRWESRSRSCGGSSECVDLRECSSTERNLVSCGRRWDRPRRVCCPIETEFVNDIGPFQGEPIASITTDSTCGISIFPNTNIVRSPLIMNGEEAPQGLYPWMAALLKRNRRGRLSFECTAFLIDRRHVLSAGHCFRPNDPTRYTIRIGNVDWRLGESYDLSKIDIPQGYRRGYYYDDIAVLTLNREVTQPNVVPVCLPSGPLARRDLTGTGTIVAGWGAQFHEGELSDTLRHLIAMPAMSNTECNQRLARNLSGFRSQFSRGITRGFICAGFMEGGKDSCGGDSGGPLMIREDGIYYAVGIVSFGYECGRPGFPAGYTRITEYRDYINRHTT